MLEQNEIDGMKTINLMSIPFVGGIILFLFCPSYAYADITDGMLGVFGFITALGLFGLIAFLSALWAIIKGLSHPDGVHPVAVVSLVCLLASGFVCTVGPGIMSGALFLVCAVFAIASPSLNRKPKEKVYKPPFPLPGSER